LQFRDDLAQVRCIRAIVIVRGRVRDTRDQLGLSGIEIGAADM
jgi:hypothetical protein